VIGSLFTGIGGLDLGLERAGLGPVAWQAEIDPWCREVCDRHWPGIRRYSDVREVDGEADRVRVVCGGFPCQPVSVAGKRAAQSDARWLWPEVARIVDALRPALVICENVPGLRTAGLRDVLADLARLGFDAEWTHFRAWDIGAPHIRNRFWLVATNPERVVLRDEPGWLSRACGALEAKPRNAGARVPPDADPLRRLEQARQFAHERGWSERCGWALDPAPRVDDGPAAGLARGGRERARKAAGNAVVVACAEEVGRATVAACSVIA
jgi:site-specific DNA-cytosine methylase